MGTSVYDILGVIADFDDNLTIRDVDRRQTILSHLKSVDKLNYHVSDFKLGLDWLNVSKPLTLSEHLKGHIVVLDFFTYCCINCMHILPDLEVVEKKYPPQSGVTIVGVHSAKFLNEKVTANILSAVLRHNIQHPVVNDEDAVMWQELAVSCWPTLVFLGPAGQLIYSLAGEGHRAWILEFLQVASEYYSSQLRHGSIPISLEKDKAVFSKLSFPGKVFYWSEKNWIVIADSGNHKILVTDTTGVVQIVVGSGSSGLKDGDFLSAEFSSPQGIACYKNCIYVADTGNHCLRSIDLELRSVNTIAGTGHQGTDIEGGKLGKDQEIASPWDVVLGFAPDGSSPVLYVAMAGTHQIWVYFITHCTWHLGRSCNSGTCIRFAGSGKEENRNSTYPDKASFAQPSGLALSYKDPSRRLYVADSESSSIRAVNLVDRAVKGLVGGEIDPKNLFAYGDVDGSGVKAKLQHPLGVAFLDGRLIVADSYNHKIKNVDLNTLMCKTYAGTGHPGSALDNSALNKCEFNEPGGVSVDETGKLIYVADTNNHAIKVINDIHKTIFQLPIIFPDEIETTKATRISDIFSQSKNHNKLTEDHIVSLPDVVLPATSSTITLKVPLNLPEETHLNTDAPNSWKVCVLDTLDKELKDSLPLSALKGKLHSFTTRSESSTGHASLTLTFIQSALPGIYTLKVTIQTFHCLNEQDVCLPPSVTHFKQTIRLK
uniref:Thioredoxin domain-containing protein n=1 Tax=Arion vulgaris TaxID=1028688 RepID=A0A0B7B7U1_9EUPU